VKRVSLSRVGLKMKMNKMGLKAERVIRIKKNRMNKIKVKAINRKHKSKKRCKVRSKISPSKVLMKAKIKVRGMLKEDPVRLAEKLLNVFWKHGQTEENMLGHRNP